MMDFCILGSGVAGSTIANLLSKKHSVHVFDKARGPGGRSSNKRFKTNLSFDHGVQYISPKSKAFINAFLRRIGKEKKQIEICDKIISKSGFEEFFEGDQMGTSSEYNSIKDSVDQRRKGNK